MRVHTHKHSPLREPRSRIMLCAPASRCLLPATDFAFNKMRSFDDVDALSAIIAGERANNANRRYHLLVGDVREVAMLLLA